MKPNQKLSSAIVAILGGYAAVASAQQQAATTPAAAPSEAIADIVVTAQRRSESIQDVPITIQAMTSETLSQLSVTTFDDMARYLPNVALSSNGPSQGNIFMRGLALGNAGTQSSGTIGLYPNVAVYLDEQSGQLPGRNLDVYAADLERIEILEGPQGTLFGGGAEAGVVRYITNKPKLNKFEGSAEGMYGTTAHGDTNSGFTAVLNLPLVDDAVALRAVLYNEARGGYINNVPSTFTRRNTDLGIYYANYPAVGGACPDGKPNNGLCVPPGSPVINNYNMAKDAINPVTYKGGRFSLLWQMSDDWSALLQQSYQDMHAEGVFYQMPKSSEGVTLQPLEVTLFQPSYDTDKFENTALTINGKLGFLKAVYAGGYLIRNVDQVQDYTNYARGVYADYYQCYGPHSGGFSAAGNYSMYGVGDPNLTSTCFSPAATWREQERNTHQSHEIRLSTPDELPIRGLIGGFWEELKIFDQTDWDYKTMPNCPANVVAYNKVNGTGGGFGCEGDLGIPPGVTHNGPVLQNDNVGFFEDTTRGYKQLAFFGSVDWDIIPKVLTLTAGTRHYDYKLSQRGWVGTSFGCFEAPAPCYGYGHNMDAEHLNAEYKGFKSRANLTWHITPDAMVYATWSQGYRPGGFNRTSGTALPGLDVDANGKHIPQYIKPLTFSPDSLTNVEVGFKTEFFNRRLQLDGSIYKEDWKSVQTGLFNPGVLGNLTLAVNGADYQVKGAELQLTARATESLSVIGAMSYNDAKQVDSPFLIDNNPASANFGNQITQYFFRGALKQIVNTFGSPGTPTAYSPKWQANLRTRYDFKVGDYGAFWQVGVIYVGEMFNNTNTDPSVNGDSAAIQNINTTLFRFKQAAYTTFDASAGVNKDNWTIQLFGQNLTNQHASTFTSTAQFVKTEIPLRPQVLGVRATMKF